MRAFMFRIALPAVTLAIAGAAILGWLNRAPDIPSMVRDPISAFVQPGVTVWWLILGGPFRTVPYSAGGIAFAAAANALLWLLVMRIVAAVYGLVRRKLAAWRS